MGCGPRFQLGHRLMRQATVVAVAVAAVIAIVIIEISITEVSTTVIRILLFLYVTSCALLILRPCSCIFHVCYGIPLFKNIPVINFPQRDCSVSPERDSMRRLINASVGKFLLLRSRRAW
jgi:hypothetical protein